MNNIETIKALLVVVVPLIIFGYITNRYLKKDCKRFGGDVSKSNTRPTK